MRISKTVLQNEVEKIVNSSEYTEKFGEYVLEIAETTIYKKCLNYRYNEFEIEFIIKPRIVDMLLLKIFKYNKDMASAYTFCGLIVNNAIISAIKDIRRASRGDEANVYYIEDLAREVAMISDSSYNDILSDLYIEGGEIILN